MVPSGTRWHIFRVGSALASLALVWACSNTAPDQQKAQQPGASPAAESSALKAAPSLPKQKTAAALAPAAIDTFLKPDRPLEARDYIWDPSAAAQGPLRIVVDIDAQRVYVYRGRSEIGRSTMIYGAEDKPTPFGTFPILEKDKDHVSNLYDADMPYMLRLTWDGIAIHGSEVEDWAATNGCIGVPDEFGALLFAEAKLGDSVTITRNWMPEIYGTEA